MASSPEPGGWPGSGGSCIVMRVPPTGSRSARIVPPSALTTWATMASPKPELRRPGRRSIEAIEDVRKILVGCSGPWSRTTTAPSRQSTVTTSPTEAPFPGVVEETSRRRTSGQHRPLPKHSSEVRSNDTSCNCPCVASSHGVADEKVQPEGFPPHRSWSPRASSARSPTKSVSSCSCTRTSSTSNERSATENSSTRRMTSRFVRKLVRGVRRLVRCIHDELALGAPGQFEGFEQPVERASQASQLIWSTGVQPKG